MRAIVEYGDSSFAAWIHMTPAGEFRLDWTDHVIGEWSETFPELSTAVIRLGVLIHAVATDQTFTEEEREFRRAVGGWLGGRVA